MHSGFYYFFWGLLLQFNIKVKGFDILPDFLGYYLIYKGLKLLLEESKSFEIASKAVLPLMVLSLVNLYNFENLQAIPVFLILALDIVKIIVFALNIYLVYHLFQGAIEVARSIRDQYMHTTLKQRLTIFLLTAGIYLVLNIVSQLPLTSMGNIIGSIFSASFLVYILYLFSLILVVAAMYRMHKELSPASIQPVREKTSGGKTSQSKRKR